METPPCPDCGCTVPTCACLLTVQVEYERRTARQAVEQAAFYREMLRQACGTILANREKIGRPRGGDERRLLAYVDSTPGAVLGTGSRLAPWGVDEHGQCSLFAEAGR